MGSDITKGIISGTDHVWSNAGMSSPLKCINSSKFSLVSFNKISYSDSLCSICSIFFFIWTILNVFSSYLHLSMTLYWLSLDVLLCIVSIDCMCLPAISAGDSDDWKVMKWFAWSLSFSKNEASSFILITKESILISPSQELCLMMSKASTSSTSPVNTRVKNSFQITLISSVLSIFNLLILQGITDFLFLTDERILAVGCSIVDAVLAKGTGTLLTHWSVQLASYDTYVEPIIHITK